ncbi:MAG: hypothetical protein K1000chlam3_01337 [Chlamydiae bacterium]|nr:hypothetical protein [Chlamydiota bacterium]
MRKIIVFLLACFSSLGANEEEKYIVLPEEQVHEGDYFAAGGIIEVSGIVKGDVYAFGTQILVDGHVFGSVIATGGSVEISGIVEGNARLAGGQISINGTIGRNVTAAAGNIQLVSKAIVGGNAVFTGGIIDIAGDIKGDLTLSASNARLLGDVGRNVHAYTGKLRVGSKADIGGNLDYSSSEKAFIDPGARIEGKITYKPSVITQVFKGKWRQGVILGSRLMRILMSVVFSFVIGVIFCKLFPKKLARTLKTLGATPWKSFWTGLLILILLPIACIILFITILGFPIGIALLAFSVLGFYAAKIIPIFWVSNAVFHKPNSLLGLAIVLIAFFLIAQIPILGPLLSMVFTLIGLGALTLSRMPKKHK